MEKMYEFAVDLVKNAGKLIQEEISNRSKKVDMKTCDIDLVTETDKAVENFLISSLSKEYPDHKFIGEESVADGKKVELTDNPTWIIDPIDGTLNFVHTFPHSCISLALFQDKVSVIGIVYNPMLNQLFTAQKGRGAYLNGKQIKVSNTTEISKALMMFEQGTSRDAEKQEVVLKNTEVLLKSVHGMRSLGSAALDMAMVACGAADAYFEFGTHIWDIAAGELLVTEAGGVILDPAGGPLDHLSRRFLVASNSSLAEQIVSKLEQYYPKPTD